MRIGLGLPPLGMAMDLCTEIVQRAESANFDSVWVGEAWGTETCTMVGALLARSQRIHVGTGIVSLYLRPPTLTAMQAATLDLIAPGRARLGLGVSTRNINTFHGLAWDFPLTRTREYVALLRRLLAGERVSHEGRFYRPHGFQLSVPAPHQLPIYLAAVNPKMLQLAGEIADGVQLAWLPARQVPYSLAEIATGARRAGRRLEDIDVGCYIHTMVTGDRERTLEQMRRILAGYCQANTYIQGFRRFGYGEIVDQVHACWKAGDRAQAQAAIPDTMVEDLYIFGTAEECHTQLRAFTQAGLSLAVVAALPSSRLTPDELRTLVDAFAQ